MLALSKSDSSRSSSSLCRGENQTTHSPSTGMQGVISREHYSVSEQSTKDPHKTARHHRLSSAGTPKRSAAWFLHELTSYSIMESGRVIALLALTGRVHKNVSQGIRKQVNLLYQIDGPARQSISPDLDYS